MGNTLMPQFGRRSPHHAGISGTMYHSPLPNSMSTHPNYRMISPPATLYDHMYMQRMYRSSGQPNSTGMIWRHQPPPGIHFSGEEQKTDKHGSSLGFMLEGVERAAMPERIPLPMPQAYYQPKVLKDTARCIYRIEQPFGRAPQPTPQTYYQPNVLSDSARRIYRPLVRTQLQSNIFERAPQLTPQAYYQPNVLSDSAKHVYRFEQPLVRTQPNKNVERAPQLMPQAYYQPNVLSDSAKHVYRFEQPLVRTQASNNFESAPQLTPQACYQPNVLSDSARPIYRIEQPLVRTELSNTVKPITVYENQQPLCCDLLKPQQNSIEDATKAEEPSVTSELKTESFSKESSTSSTLPEKTLGSPVTTKPTKKQSVIDDKTVVFLEADFERNKSPNQLQITEIAERHHLTKKAVRTWFSSRRQKQKSLERENGMVKKQSVIEDDTVVFLEADFERNRSPNQLQIAKLAEKHHLTKEAVHAWFSSRRQKQKRLKKKNGKAKKKFARASRNAGSVKVPSKNYNITVEVPSINPRDRGSVVHQDYMEK